MHAAFARWLEQAGDGRDEHAPLLAHHYAEAVRPEDVDLAWAGEETELAELRARACVWLRRAAELAIGRFELDDGLALLHRALELEPSDAERAMLWREIGHANVLKRDGEAFWTAMQRSLESWDDRATAADTYSELAFHATTHGMWRRQPDPKRIAEWVERALDLSEPGTPARAKALIASACRDPAKFGAAALEASELAERLDVVELRSWAWEARSREARARGDYAEALEWTRRRVGLVEQLTDPDHISLIYLFGLSSYWATGRLEEARKVAQAHDDVTSRLTPHHRLHAVALLIGAEKAAGRWEAACDLGARAEQAVAANLDTPCALNAVSLLHCAQAYLHQGNEEEARRLERQADDLGLEGWGFLLDPIRVELALARGDLAEVERKLAEWRPRGFYEFLGLVVRLNALVALERRNEIEQEAPALVELKGYVEPFALRALGYAREDKELVERAIERFQAMDLAWHAAETRKLLVSA